MLPWHKVMKSVTVKKSFKGKCKLTCGKVSMLLGFHVDLIHNLLCAWRKQVSYYLDHKYFKAESNDWPLACSKKKKKKKKKKTIASW